MPTMETPPKGTSSLPDQAPPCPPDLPASADGASSTGLRIIRRSASAGADMSGNHENSEATDKQSDGGPASQANVRAKSDGRANGRKTPGLLSGKPRELFKPSEPEKPAAAALAPPVPDKPSLLPHLGAALLFSLALALTIAIGMLQNGHPLILKPLWTGIAAWLIVLLSDILLVARRRLLFTASSLLLALSLLALLLALGAESVIPLAVTAPLATLLPRPPVSGSICLLAFCSAILIRMRTWPKYPVVLLGTTAAAALLAVYARPLLHTAPPSKTAASSPPDPPGLVCAANSFFSIGLPQTWSAHALDGSLGQTFRILSPDTCVAMSLKRSALPAGQSLTDHAAACLLEAQKQYPQASGIITSSPYDTKAKKIFLRSGDTVIETTLLPTENALFVVTVQGLRQRVRERRSEIDAILSSFRPRPVASL